MLAHGSPTASRDTEGGRVSVDGHGRGEKRRRTVVYCNFPASTASLPNASVKGVRGSGLRVRQLIGASSYSTAGTA